MAEHIEVGKLGEDLVLEHYKKRGFKHLESNYRAKTGEIDIIVRLGNVIHFIEVKSVSRGKNFQRTELVPHGTWRPEENVHSKKLRRLTNTIQVWLSHRRYLGDWQLDVASVHIDVPHETGNIDIIENVIVE